MDYPAAQRRTDEGRVVGQTYIDPFIVGGQVYDGPPMRILSISVPWSSTSIDYRGTDHQNISSGDRISVESISIGKDAYRIVNISPLSKKTQGKNRKSSHN